MSLLRSSRIANSLTKEAIIGILGKGLWGAAKGAKAAVGKIGILPSLGLAGGAATAGVGAHEALKSSQQDMSAEGFGQRMGYGGG